VLYGLNGSLLDQLRIFKTDRLYTVARSKGDLMHLTASDRPIILRASGDRVEARANSFARASLSPFLAREDAQRATAEELVAVHPRLSVASGVHRVLSPQRPLRRLPDSAGAPRARPSPRLAS